MHTVFRAKGQESIPLQLKSGPVGVRDFKIASVS